MAFRKLLLTLKERGFVRRTLLLLPAWITPNGVTVFRGLLAAPIMLLLAAQSYWPAIWLLAFALALDFVDGALAQVRNLKSETGAYLDPLADKVLICGPLLMAGTGLGWPWLTLSVAITAVAVLLTAVRTYKWYRTARGTRYASTTVAANAAGKLKMIAEAAGVITLLLARSGTLGAVSTPLLWLSFGLLLVALRYALPSLVGQLRGLSKGDASPQS